MGFSACYSMGWLLYPSPSLHPGCCHRLQQTLLRLPRLSELICIYTAIARDPALFIRCGSACAASMPLQHRCGVRLTSL